MIELWYIITSTKAYKVGAQVFDMYPCLRNYKHFMQKLGNNFCEMIRLQNLEKFQIEIGKPIVLSNLEVENVHVSKIEIYDTFRE